MPVPIKIVYEVSDHELEVMMTEKPTLWDDPEYRKPSAIQIWETSDKGWILEQRIDVQVPAEDLIEAVLEDDPLYQVGARGGLSYISITGHSIDTFYVEVS